MSSLANNGMHFMLTTNGVCSDDVLESILSAKTYCIGVKSSLDGYDANSHTYIRRDKNNQQNDEIFYSTIKTINFFRKHRINCTIATCLHSHNIENFDKMISLVKELRPNTWYISTISNKGRAAENMEIFVSESALPLSYWHELKKRM